MFDRLRQSLALRLAGQYTVVFALCTAMLFGVLYWLLAHSLEQRDQEAVEHRADDFAAAYQVGGPAGLSSMVHSDTAPDVHTLFVRLISPANVAVFVAAPPGWIETQVERFPVPDWEGVMAERKTQTVRVPQNALKDYTIASHPLADGWLLQVGRLTDSRPVLLAPLRRAFVWVGGGALLVSVLIGTLLAWRATRPLRLVSATARRILETGDLAARVPGSRGSGELDVLVSQLNTLLDRNATHVGVLRDTLDNLAHDLRTPLTRLRGTAELAMQDNNDPVEARAALADCVNESDRLLHLLETLLDISAAEGGALKLNRTRFDLRTLVERAADLYLEVAEEAKITVTLDLTAAVEVNADAIRLGQAINNLVDNALKYTPAGGRVALAVSREGNDATFTVTDSGPGVPEKERTAIFRRLYRSDSSRSQRGFGLGLSLAKAIAEAHGGTITVSDAPAGGARFTLVLPIV
jgi:signal transduction histidine kinase